MKDRQKGHPWGFVNEGQCSKGEGKIWEEEGTCDYWVWLGLLACEWKWEEPSCALEYSVTFNC